MSNPEFPTLSHANVCIVGFADSRRIVPFDHPDMEFWGINALHRATDLPKGAHWHRWFQLHDIEQHHKEPDDFEEHVTFLRSLDCPVYLRPQDIGRWGIPNEVPFPLEQVIAPFPRYFNNTISFLIALAIHMKPEELHIYGVDMATDSISNAEYAHQRPSVELFIGAAMGQGIRVNIPTNSDLLKATHLYGFEDAEAFTTKHMARLEELAHRKNQMKQELAQLQGRSNELSAAVNQLDGAMQSEEYWLRTWVPNPITSMPLSTEVSDDGNVHERPDE